MTTYHRANVFTAHEGRVLDISPGPAIAIDPEVAEKVGAALTRALVSQKTVALGYRVCLAAITIKRREVFVEVAPPRLRADRSVTLDSDQLPDPDTFFAVAARELRTVAMAAIAEAEQKMGKR